MEKRKINPREHANIFSLFTFGYTLDLFKKGLKRDLDENDLYGIIESCESKRCGDQTEKQWGKSQSIYKLLWVRFGWEYTIICLVTIGWTEIYRKILRLSPGAFSDTNLGNIVTILTNDINVIEDNVWILLEFVIAFVQTCTISYLLWVKMGNSAFIGIGLLFLTIPVQLNLSTLLTKIRLKAGTNSDERLQVTQQTLSAIKIIKMYTWESYFEKKISKSRNLYNDLTTTFGYSIPLNTTRAAEFRAAFIRLNKLLHAEEIIVIRENGYNKPLLELNGVKVKIRDKDILENISMKIDKPGLTLVTGTIGSGKSSLLKTILRDYCLLTGDITVHGSISYASQEPWLFPASIRQNIVFGERYDKNRYEEVIKICALEYDFSLLEFGDDTLVADRGLNLSKGQQARINLARAVYKNSDIYLLDDSLTALDVGVQDFIFRECIEKYLKCKICVLVTQNASHLEKSENIVVMDSGRLSLTRNIKNDPKKVNNLATTSEDLTNPVPTACNSNNSMSNKTDANSTQTEPSDTKVYHENKKMGKVDLVVYKRYLEYGGGPYVFMFIIFLYTLAQICENYSDQLLTNWVDLQQKVLDLKLNSTLNKTIFEESILQKDSTFNWYTIMIIVKSAMGLMKFYALLSFCRSASINIHQVMTSTVIKAAMSFFDTHFIGNILNRFSHDLYNIDENLPYVFPELTSVNISAGNVGLALTQVVILTDYVQWGIRQWAQVENHMTSVERVLEYTNIKSESKEGDEIKNWPNQGTIRYENVTLKYENTTKPVLKNISFCINPRQKIGIVGRTGAGKSSVISTLFRVYNYQGKILIDDVDISNLSMNFLRKNIAIIPQDPIVFTGTIRKNIDPDMNYTDDQIWETIRKVKIKDIIPSLDLKINESASNFSAGQKQLICLARAAIGKYKIVILDEATANMDPATDVMLHEVIEEIFSDCTVVTVSHRLNSILNGDVIMVMEKGEIIEFDNPQNLLQNSSSIFYKMYKDSGIEK
ncbi:hypothetical protein NQ314_015403 [Rhamnusium bicolor]|uniref:Multidrug resistance-associated protein lethal(2)03659 n=1 Tax=Rhamnusium bicolor TaxID=1586634 RepID=A0AAV8WYW9_9CUCU|nr:hypothetical protein NQ314_015403 [Rhamnusium bicolor]